MMVMFYIKFNKTTKVPEELEASSKKVLRERSFSLTRWHADSYYVSAVFDEQATRNFIYNELKKKFAAKKVTFSENLRTLSTTKPYLINITSKLRIGDVCAEFCDPPRICEKCNRGYTIKTKTENYKLFGIFKTKRKCPYYIGKKLLFVEGIATCSTERKESLTKVVGALVDAGYECNVLSKKENEIKEKEVFRREELERRVSKRAEQFCPSWNDIPLE